MSIEVVFQTLKKRNIADWDKVKRDVALLRFEIVRAFLRWAGLRGFLVLYRTGRGYHVVAYLSADFYDKSWWNKVRRIAQDDPRRLFYTEVLGGRNILFEFKNSRGEREVVRIGVI